MRRLAFVIIGIAVMSLVACGGVSNEPVAQVKSSETVTSTAPQPSPSVAQAVTDADLDNFFRALATDEPVRIKHATKLTVPGSMAEAYAAYLYYRALASEQDGNDASPQSVTRVDNGWKACPPKKGGGTCITWADVETSGGKVANYTINGKNLSKRIVIGSTKKTYRVGSLAAAQLVMAYRSVQSNNTFVVLRTQDGEWKSTFADDTAYRAPSGAQMNGNGMIGPDTLLPNAKAYVVFTFPDSPLGGVMYLDMFTADGPARSGSVTIPLK